MALENMGYLTLKELKAQTTYPTEERFKKGPVAVIECTHEIPCNPCEGSCRFGAIQIGDPITNLPRLEEDKCIGCGICVAQCPGLAIFIVDKTYSDTQASVSFPYEYHPVPEVGQEVDAVDRSGKTICPGVVVKVQQPKSYDRTPVVTVTVDLEYAESVRSIKRKQMVQEAEDDMLVCRCEEVTVGEIKEAIRQGARDVTGVKRRTRAGMGLCQGRTCEKLVQAILRQELGNTPEEISISTPRPPVRPVTFGVLGRETANEEF